MPAPQRAPRGCSGAPGRAHLLAMTETRHRFPPPWTVANFIRGLPVAKLPELLRGRPKNKA